MHTGNINLRQREEREAMFEGKSIYLNSPAVTCTHVREYILQ